MRAASLLTFAAPALLACAGAGTSTATPTPAAARTAREALPACPDAPAGAAEQWRQVAGPGFRICVPAPWQEFAPRDTSGIARGGWRMAGAGSIAWNAGPRAATRGEMIPYNDRRESTLWLGTREGRLIEYGLPGLTTFLVNVPATATEPELRMTLLARTEATKAQLLAAVRTLRPAMAGATSGS